jgi:arsenate reductase-like glutaredoxin family protein
MDEQGVIENVVTTLARIEAAKTSDELAAIVDTEMTPEEQVGLASQLNIKTKELLDRESKKTKRSLSAGKSTDEATPQPTNGRSTTAKS